MLNNNKLIILSVLFTPNNILFSVSNLKGQTLFWTSTGSKKLKGTKKITFAFVILIVKNIKYFINKLEYKFIFIKIKGFNKNKKIFLRCLKQYFGNVVLIYEKTSFPHNGCKKSKLRRI
uniref:ribosomal protein S11 n=1 Tax=Cystoclonium purpureum f. stellatum TaxID=3024809 RepID=UPI0023F1D816|nr:ribosomal protein S11 [Cystoclonium purpureum f. stellatum]WDY85185.1 ribosomal protein S11 [Cystoclonium purpureum f. stellatum]